jgi:hypothetical protein
LAGSYLFIFSENGILERRELQKKYNQLTDKIANIKETNSIISNECEKYRSGKFSNKDIIDSGFIYRTGRVMYISDNQIQTNVTTQDEFNNEFMLSLEHLRFIWILVSIMILFFYFFREYNSRKSTYGSDIN